MAEDSSYLIKKLLGIAELIQENLKVLVINLPAEPSSVVDTYTYYARKLCDVFARNGGELSVFFIKLEDKHDLVNRVFKRDKKHYTQESEVKLSLSLSEGTLLYAWGSAYKGKLGLY